MVAYPAIKSILSDLNQLSHAHLDEHHHHVRLLYQGSCASKSMEPLLVTQLELKNLLPHIPCSEGICLQRKEICAWGHAAIATGALWPCRRAPAASAVLD